MSALYVAQAIVDLDEMQKGYPSYVAVILIKAMHDLAALESETNPHHAERDALPDTEMPGGGIDDANGAIPLLGN